MALGLTEQCMENPYRSLFSIIHLLLTQHTAFPSLSLCVCVFVCLHACVCDCAQTYACVCVFVHQHVRVCEGTAKH